jgi:RimJ/RimL family protein N-acetyltransferase
MILGWYRDVASDISAQASRSANTAASASALQNALENSPLQMLMIVAPDGEPVGLVEWNWLGGPQVRAAEIGVVIGVPGLWNLGFGGDAYDTLVSHLFLHENAHRVQFAVASTNARMVSSLARFGGPVLEGIRREAAYVDGQYDDLLLYGILRSEFDDIIPLAPDLESRISARRELKLAGAQRLRKHLESTQDSAVQHVLNGVVPGLRKRGVETR